jgi:biopolymer transport protein ExbD
MTLLGAVLAAGLALTAYGLWSDAASGTLPTPQPCPPECDLSGPPSTAVEYGADQRLFINTRHVSLADVGRVLRELNSPLALRFTGAESISFKDVWTFFFLARVAGVERVHVTLPATAGLSEAESDVVIGLGATSRTRLSPIRVGLTHYPSGALELDRRPVAPGDLAERLRETYEARRDKVLWLEGKGTVSYGDIMRDMSVAVRSGVEAFAIDVPSVPLPPPPPPPPPPAKGRER